MTAKIVKIKPIHGSKFPEQLAGQKAIIISKQNCGILQVTLIQGSNIGQSFFIHETNIEPV